MTWATSVPILVFLGLSVLDLGPMNATDRQTDVRQKHRLMHAPVRGNGIITVHDEQYSMLSIYGTLLRKLISMCAATLPPDHCPYLIFEIPSVLLDCCFGDWKGDWPVENLHQQFVQVLWKTCWDPSDLE